MAEYRQGAEFGTEGRDFGSHICHPHLLTRPQLLNGMTSPLDERVIEGQVSPEPDLQVDKLLCQHRLPHS